MFSLGHYQRRLHGDQFPGVLVLCYHGIRPDDLSAGSMPFEELHVRASEFESHCRLLKENCHPISAETWRQAINGQRPLPERPVLVTFDDGYSSVYTQAYPILQKYELPAVVLICSDPVEQRQMFWYDSLARKAGEAEVEKAKRLNYDDWHSQRNDWLRVVPDDDPCAPLTIEQVKELATSPRIEIGAHTAIHQILSRANFEQQRAEIVRGKSMLESWINRPVSAFAYPNGQPVEDYTPETVEVVKEAGFDLAFTTNYGFATQEESRLELSRFMMLAGISQAELAHRICYSWRKS